MPAMLLPIDFVLARAELTWREMVVGLDRGCVQPRDALTVAHRQVEAGEQSPLLNDLLELGPEDRLLPSVMALAADEPEQEPSEMLALWGDLALAWSWQYREALADPLATIADLWSDFDYPPAWEPLIHYLQTADGATDAAQTREAILAQWEAHVIARFGPDLL
jgi:hypothetical protein